MKKYFVRWVVFGIALFSAYFFVLSSFPIFLVFKKFLLLSIFVLLVLDYFFVNRYFSRLFYPYIRDLILFFGLWEHSGRQDFLIGRLANSVSVSDFRNHLRKNGFEHDVLAWVDDGEVLSERKLIDNKFQYHVRLFRDGEVRCHKEFAPEFSVFYHLTGKFFVPAASYFNNCFSNLVIKFKR